MLIRGAHGGKVVGPTKADDTNDHRHKRLSFRFRVRSINDGGGEREVRICQITGLISPGPPLRDTNSDYGCFWLSLQLCPHCMNIYFTCAVQKKHALIWQRQISSLANGEYCSTPLTTTTNTVVRNFSHYLKKVL